MTAQAVVSATLGRSDARYRVEAVHDGLRAQNPVQALRTDFTRHGMQVRTGDGTHWGMALHGYGYGDGLEMVREAAPHSDGNRVEYRRGTLVEWYVNGPAGLEQGFTLSAPPSSGDRNSRAHTSNDPPLTIALGLAGDLTAAADRSPEVRGVAQAEGLTLHDDNGQAVLRYTGLNAHDANGRELVSWMELSGHEVRLRVEDAGARYPVVVDPFIQVAKLTASDGQADDELGQSVSVSSDGGTVVAAASSANLLQGAAYVFVMSAGGWTSAAETAKLTASDGASGDELGKSVSISGDGGTIVLGAPFAAINSNSEQGAAYVFVKPASGWVTATETAKLTDSDGTKGDELGYSVGISNDSGTIVAGALGYQDFQGAASVFVKPTGGWTTATQIAELTASDGAAKDGLGSSVGVSSDGGSIVGGAAGANGNVGAAYVFVKPTGGWTTATQTAALTASDGVSGDELGDSVSISGDGGTMAAGAAFAAINSHHLQGAVYVFVKPILGWSTATETAKLSASDGTAGEHLGISESVSGDGGIIVAGTAAFTQSVPGAAYVFVRPSSGWATVTQTAKLIPSDSAAADFFGFSVGISEDASTIVAGASNATIGSNAGQGAAYVFAQPISQILGADAQRFGVLADDEINLAHSSTVSFIHQSPEAPEVGADTANIAGPSSQIGGDLITSSATGSPLSLGDHDTVIGACVTGGESIVLGTGATCGSTDTGGTNPLLTTLASAQTEAESYAGYLAGLTTTTTLGNITLKKSQSLTVKLGKGINVVAIGNLTTAGSNTITLSGPASAVAVVNVSGTLSLGASTQITIAGGLSAHNLIWNIESANPAFGASVGLSGTLLNVASSTTVTFGAGSSISGAVLTNGSVVSDGAMHLNFWPFTAAPANPTP